MRTLLSQSRILLGALKVIGDFLTGAASYTFRLRSRSVSFPLLWRPLNRCFPLEIFGRDGVWR